MIKKILVPASGRSNDARVFATALSIARPLGAHLEFLHARMSACEAAVHTPHVGFCRGAAMTDALEHLSRQEAEVSLDAIGHFQTFCAAHAIPLARRPLAGAGAGVSAHFEQETDIAKERLVTRARHCDLIVLDRPAGARISAFNSIESFLLNTGRPLVIAGEAPTDLAGRTMIVGWQERAEAAHSLAAAMPILQLAHSVVLVNISESPERALPMLRQVESQLAWHDVQAQALVAQDHPRSAAQHLLQIARQRRAGLLVIGGFGRGPVREALFGGVTRSLLQQASCPIFVMH